jgi:hypothetical protein
VLSKPSPSLYRDLPSLYRRRVCFLKKKKKKKKKKAKTLTPKL